MSQADRLFASALRLLSRPPWTLYYARWERRERRRIIGHIWTAIARIEVNRTRGRQGRGLAFFSLLQKPAPTRGERRSLARSAEFHSVLNELEDAGYRRIGDFDPSDQLLKQFPATHGALRKERLRLDAILGPTRAERLVKSSAATGIAAARSEFASAPRWRSAGAGWSIRAELADGCSAIFAVLLVQREDGTLIGRRELRAQACVLVWPPDDGCAVTVERYVPIVRSAGYSGGLQRMPRRGQRKRAFFADFWKDRLGAAQIGAELRRLEALRAEVEARAAHDSDS